MRPLLRKILYWIAPELQILRNPNFSSYNLLSSLDNVQLGENVRVYPPYHLIDVNVGNYTYIALNSHISLTDIGKCCSIGPNFLCGWGIHPTQGVLSTSPMFYSNMRQNGLSLCKNNKIEERKKILIGNDVFIGANVTILDGVTIGDGAVIGAGAVVSKDIPPYAIAVGCLVRIIRYRMTDDQIAAMQRIQFWNWDIEKMSDVEIMFDDIDSFISKYDTKF